MGEIVDVISPISHFYYPEVPGYLPKYPGTYFFLDRYYELITLYGIKQKSIADIDNW